MKAMTKEDRVKAIIDYAKKVMQYPKGSKGYDPIDTINLRGEIAKYESQPTSKLITAAPDMLDALQRVEKSINNRGLNNLFGHTQQYIREAIEKATK